MAAVVARWQRVRAGLDENGRRWLDWFVDESTQPAEVAAALDVKYPYVDAGHSRHASVRLRRGDQLNANRDYRLPGGLSSMTLNRYVRFMAQGGHTRQQGSMSAYDPGCVKTPANPDVGVNLSNFPKVRFSKPLI